MDVTTQHVLWLDATHVNVGYCHVNPFLASKACCNMEFEAVPMLEAAIEKHKPQAIEALTAALEEWM